MTRRVRASLRCRIAAVIASAGLLVAAGPALARSTTVTPAGSGAGGTARALGMTGPLSSSAGISMVMSCGAAGYCTVAGTVTHTRGDVAYEAARPATAPPSDTTTSRIRSSSAR